MLITDRIYDELVQREIDVYKKTNSVLSEDELDVNVCLLKAVYDKIKNDYRHYHVFTRINDVLFLMDWNGSEYIEKEREKIARNIELFKAQTDNVNERISRLGARLDYFGFLSIEETRLKVLDYALNNSLPEDVDRTIFNYLSYREIINTMGTLLNFNPTFSNYDVQEESGEKALVIHASLAMLNMYFEDIYKDIDRIMSEDYTGMSSLEVENVIQQRCNALSEKYVNRDDLISTVMNKYFTDHGIVRMPRNVPPRSTFALMRSQFSQNANCRQFIDLRNLSSHGDYNVVDQNGVIQIVKNGVASVSYEELLSFVKSKIYNINPDYKCFVDLINKFTEENANSELSEQERLEFLVKLSAFVVIQYNTQHYFKELKTDDGVSITDKMNADKVFSLKRGGVDITASGYDILEYIKNALGHGNVAVNDSVVSFYNQRTDTTVTADVLDYLEFLLQPEFVYSLSYTGAYRVYRDKCRELGIPINEGFAEIVVDSGPRGYLESVCSSEFFKNANADNFDAAVEEVIISGKGFK